MTTRIAGATRPTAGGRFDRDEILARTDLAGLADELLGGHIGVGRSAKWPSPVPGHPQTGVSPPMSIFRTRSGEERWTCFATGASGSAIDLVMLSAGCDVRQAIEWLASRTAIPARIAFNGERHWIAATRTAVAPSTTRVHPRVEAYVATCERRLWRPEGRTALGWLTAVRRFDESTLRANRVGFDPGPTGFKRPRGLPRLGAAVVFPALGLRSRAVYFQARYLEPVVAGRKYDNPGAWLASNPKVADVRTANVAAGRQDLLLVTEGMPDALSAATAGYRSVAILGTANTGPDVVRSLASRPETMVLAFDRDDAGRRAVDRLVEGLIDAHRTHGIVRLAIPAPFNDLNEWLASTGPLRVTDRREVGSSTDGRSRPLRAASSAGQSELGR